MKLAQRRVRRYLRESRERQQSVTSMAMVRTNPDRWQATCSACDWQSVGEFTKVRAAALRHDGDHRTPLRGRA